MPKQILIATNRKHLSNTELLPKNELRWIGYKVDDSGDKHSYTDFVDKTTSSDIPECFKKQIAADKKVLVFVPGARSFESALNSSFDLQERISKPVYTSGFVSKKPLDTTFVGFSMAIEPGRFPEFIQKGWYQDQRRLIEDGQSHFHRFLCDLKATTNKGVDVWGQSAGSILVRLGTKVKVDNVIISASVLGHDEFDKNGAATDLVNNSNRTTVYYARNDRVLKIVERYSGYGSLVGLGGPIDFKDLLPTANFVDCRFVNKFDLEDACNHFAYELNETILCDFVNTLRGNESPVRYKAFPINNANQQSWKLHDF